AAQEDEQWSRAPSLLLLIKRERDGREN
ncbi:uncharacterized, partial [Tachysurus ichikawai]